MYFNIVSNMACWKHVACLICLTSLVHSVPLISAVGEDPELSTLRAVIAGMGTSYKVPDPAIEERFNEVRDGRKYTFFAPTNAAFAKISPSQVKALGSSINYQLLLSIIRLHIAEGYFPASAIPTLTKPIIAIEGFPLSLKGTVINSQANITATDFKADNGIFHKIDAVINPYSDYFGRSEKSGKEPGPNISDGRLNLKELLETDAQLTSYVDLVKVITPDVFTKLELNRAGGAKPLFLIPSRAAFEALPKGSMQSFVAPSNNALSAYLLGFGRVEGVVPEGGGSAYEILLGKIKGGGAAGLKLVGGYDLELVFKETGGGEIIVGNARVERETCGVNGCFWVLGKVLDPLAGVLGA